jgi:hypothetical protein
MTGLRVLDCVLKNEVILHAFHYQDVRAHPEF